MGRVCDAIISELLPKFRDIQEIVPRIHTRSLQKDMEDIVFKCFMGFAPLRHRMTNEPVFTERTSWGGYEGYFVGKWINRIYLGNPQGRRSKYERGSTITDHDEFLKLIRSHGYQIADVVRNPIRGAFREAVSLVKELIPYDTLKFTRDVNVEVALFRAYDWYSCDPVPEMVNKVLVKTIAVSTDYPYRLEISPRKELSLGNINCVLAIEDILDEVLELYREAEKEVRKVREHNERILEELKEVTAPYWLSSEIKSVLEACPTSLRGLGVR